MEHPVNEKAFTAKSLLLGFGGVAFIALFTFFNDDILRQTLFIGNHIPVGVLLYILPVALLWNPVARRLSPRFTLGGKEMVVILALTLCSGWFAYSGLYRYFQRHLVFPVLNQSGQVMWQKYQLMDNLPPKLFPLDRNPKNPEYENVYTGFKQGLKSGDQNIPLLGWPVKAWVGPLVRWWLPLLITVITLVFAMSIWVHRQWAVHEQLAYPVASVFHMLTNPGPGSTLPAVFRSRLFWWGFVPVFVLQLLNLLYKWFPTSIPEPNIGWWADGYLRNTFGESFTYFIGPSGLGNGRIFFSVVALTYFLPGEIGLSLSVAPLLWGFVGYQLFLTQGYILTGNDNPATLSGAYLAYALIILFVGRHYYLSVLRRAFFIGPGKPEERSGVIAFRFLVGAFVTLVLILIAMGLDPFVSLAYSLSLLLLFLVFSRIVCETGLFYLQSWQPTNLLLAIFGGAALGPGPFVLVGWIGTMLHQDMREALIPYVATSLKTADLAGLKSRFRFSGTLGIGLVFGLVLAFGVSTWMLYNWGGTKDAWSAASSPNIPFNSAVDVAVQVEATGQMEASKQATGFAKLALFRPDRKLMGFFGMGFALVLITSILRYRIKNWPLHPVTFLVWGIYPLRMFFYSFMLGWVVKSLIQKFGGGQVYQNLKPLFIGMVLGELAVAALSVIVGYLYYWATGLTLPPAGILPG